MKDSFREIWIQLTPSSSSKRESISGRVGEKRHPFFFARLSEDARVISMDEMGLTAELDSLGSQLSVSRINIVDPKIQSRLRTFLFEKHSHTGEVEKRQTRWLVFYKEPRTNSISVEKYRFLKISRVHRNLMNPFQFHS
jgi:hypothetical protein